MKKQRYFLGSKNGFFSNGALLVSLERISSLTGHKMQTIRKYAECGAFGAPAVEGETLEDNLYLASNVNQAIANKKSFIDLVYTQGPITQ